MQQVIGIENIQWSKCQTCCTNTANRAKQTLPKVRYRIGVFLSHISTLSLHMHWFLHITPFLRLHHFPSTQSQPARKCCLFINTKHWPAYPKLMARNMKQSMRWLFEYENEWIFSCNDCSSHRQQTKSGYLKPSASKNPRFIQEQQIRWWSLSIESLTIRTRLINRWIL